MKRHLAGFVQAILQGSVELLLFFPLLLAAIVYVFPDAGGWKWLATLPFCYTAGYAAGVYLPLTRFYRTLAVALAVGALDAYAVHADSLPVYGAAVAAGALAYRGTRFAVVPWRAYFPASFYLIGMLTYFLASFILRFAETFQPYMPLLTWTGLLALTVTLFATNQATVKQEALSVQKTPSVAGSILWQNRILVSMLLIAMLIVALFDQLRQGVVWLARLAAAAIVALLTLIPASPGDKRDEPAAPPPAGMLEPGQPAAWLKWLETAAMIFTAVALAAGFLLLLYFAARRLPSLVKRFYGWLMKVLHMGERLEAGSGYVDDVESLMNWKELQDGLKKRFAHWRTAWTDKPVKWEELTDNRERVRYLYRALLVRSLSLGYTFKPYLTPKETERDIARSGKMPQSQLEPIVALYEQVRYGGKEAGDREIAEAKARLDRNG
ncbi:DUF4129 domain-containing protein [Paenibacillus hamazuiensis]|uniref:DUF4129 domain-containing protein n=1 Tax=Paenibacillus hamazuiensis TaxID=2936508 RepID=UPI00200C5155|nr:DUF4129 domain-containing protein [Paenibacillus hamazuiensis]